MTASYLPQEYLHLVGKWLHPSSILKTRCDIRLRLMKTLDWGVETLGFAFKHLNQSSEKHMKFQVNLMTQMRSRHAIFQVIKVFYIMIWFNCVLQRDQSIVFLYDVFHRV